MARSLTNRQWLTTNLRLVTAKRCPFQPPLMTGQPPLLAGPVLLVGCRPTRHPLVKFNRTVLNFLLRSWARGSRSCYCWDKERPG